MNLRDGLLKKANESETSNLPKVTKELEEVIKVLVNKMNEDSENGLYKSELVLKKEAFPTIHYIYLDVLGFTDTYNGLTKLKYVLIHLLDLSLSIDVTKNKYDELVITVSWGYSLANDINNYLKIKDESNNLGY